jgi:hypothetical protein
MTQERDQISLEAHSASTTPPPVTRTGTRQPTNPTPSLIVHSPASLTPLSLRVANPAKAVLLRSTGQEERPRKTPSWGAIQFCPAALRPPIACRPQTHTHLQRRRLWVRGNKNLLAACPRAMVLTRVPVQQRYGRLLRDPEWQR